MNKYFVMFLGIFISLAVGMIADTAGSRNGFLERTAGVPVAAADLTHQNPQQSGEGDAECDDSFSENTRLEPEVSGQSSNVSPPVASSSSVPVQILPDREPDLKGREMTQEMASMHPAGRFVPRAVANNAWNAGEHLVFSVEYGFYKAGTATMSVVGTERVNGGMCYHIRTTAESNSFISKIYKVRDRVESYIDMRGIFSRRFEKRLREGGYSSNEFVDLYHDRMIALSTKEKRALVVIPLYVQDILSTLYYIRTFDLKVGKTETIETYADGKVYPLKVLVIKKEKVEVPAGTFMCYKVEPVLKSEGIFRQKGRLIVWLTDDKNKIPVKMTSKVAIGNIATKLESYKKAE